jgi:hypothetical protein
MTSKAKLSSEKEVDYTVECIEGVENEMNRTEHADHEEVLQDNKKY